MSGTGNTFGGKTEKFGHARKVWRSVRHVYPCGGVIENVTSFASAGKIPAGTPVKFDAKTKKITVVADSAIKGASGADQVNALGISGFLQEDVRVVAGVTAGSGTVVYAGELYEYMYEQDIVTKLKMLTNLPQIVWVQ